MSWKPLCAAADIAEQSLNVIDVDGVTVLVTRIGEDFRAYPPVCPHMEEPLVESGLCRNGVLTCTKHLWQWDLRSGEPRGPAERPMLMYPVRQHDDQLMVLIEQELEYDFDDEDDDF